MGDRQAYEDSRKGYPVTFDNLSEEYERYREDMVTALAAKDEEIARLGARHCFHCAEAYTRCPRRIELLHGWGPMDIECCSQWTPRPTEGGDQ